MWPTSHIFQQHLEVIHLTHAVARRLATQRCAPYCRRRHHAAPSVALSCKHSSTFKAKRINGKMIFDTSSLDGRRLRAGHNRSKIGRLTIFPVVATGLCHSIFRLIWIFLGKKIGIERNLNLVYKRKFDTSHRHALFLCLVRFSCCTDSTGLCRPGLYSVTETQTSPHLAAAAVAAAGPATSQPQPKLA